MPGMGDRIAGKAKEVEGAVTGDKVRETQGKGQGTKGKVEQKTSGLKDKVQGAAREMSGDAGGSKSGQAKGSAQRTKGKIEG